MERKGNILVNLTDTVSDIEIANEIPTGTFYIYDEANLDFCPKTDNSKIGD
jgi:hypothetical protein